MNWGHFVRFLKRGPGNASPGSRWRGVRLILPTVLARIFPSSLLRHALLTPNARYLASSWVAGLCHMPTATRYPYPDNHHAAIVGAKVALRGLLGFRYRNYQDVRQHRFCGRPGHSLNSLKQQTTGDFYANFVKAILIAYLRVSGGADGCPARHGPGQC